MVTLEHAAPRSPGGIRSAVGTGSWSASALVAEVDAVRRALGPFDPRVMAFCGALSERLLRLRAHPEAVSLGFWMRPASVERMAGRFRASVPAGQVVVPRGLAFHVTPANVDTVFVYSWVVSLLVGNANIVRLSSQESAARTAILEAIAATLDEARFDGLGQGNRFVLTEHDPEVLRALSATADVRVVWGGDATVELFRGFPLPVHARDVAFPDRHSLAILDAARVAELAEDALARLADAFFNDAYWFDQGACSSPRLVVWRAAPSAERTEAAMARFRSAVDDAVRRRGYQAETGIALEKMSYATAAATRAEGVRVVSHTNEATWVRLPGLTHYDRANCGGGLFFELVSGDLAGDLAELVGPRDQTATCFGIEAETLRELARSLNGRGIDRFVPIGQALAFDEVWDGIDLLHELSKRVAVDVGGEA